MGSRLRLGEVTYFSDQHQKHKVSNLVTGNGKWTSSKGYKEKLVCEISLKAPTKITRVDLGNFWSSTIDIYVGLSSEPMTKRSLFISHTFMTPRTSSTGQDNEKLVTYHRDQFDKDIVDRNWDRIKIVCHPPYYKSHDCFGVSIIDVTGIQQSSLVKGSEVEIPMNLDKSEMKKFMQEKLKHITGQTPSANRLRGISTPNHTPTRNNDMSEDSESLPDPDSPSTLGYMGTKSPRPSGFGLQLGHRLSTAGPSRGNSNRLLPTAQAGSSKSPQPPSAASSTFKSHDPITPPRVGSAATSYKPPFGANSKSHHTSPAAVGSASDPHEPPGSESAAKRRKANSGEDIASQDLDAFYVECWQFLTDALKDYSNDELYSISFNMIKQLWFKKFGLHVKGEEKNILKLASKEYLEERVSGICSEKEENTETGDNKAADGANISSTALNKIENTNNLKRRRQLCDDSEVAKQGCRENKENEARNGVCESPGSNGERNSFGANNRNTAIEDNKTAAGPTNTTQGGRKRKSTASTKRKRSISGPRLKKKPEDRRAVPDANGWLSPDFNPHYAKIAEKNLKINLSKELLGFNIANLLKIPPKELKEKGILFKVKNFRDNRILPLKDEKTLTVEIYEAVKFFKCGPDVYLSYKNCFYEPDMEEKFMVKMFEKDAPLEQLMDKSPLSEELKHFINTYGEQPTNQVASELHETGKDDVVIIEGETPRKSKKSESLVECPLCSDFFPTSEIEAHAADCTGQNEETTAEKAGSEQQSPMDSCPLCNVRMEPDLLPEHAASCDGVPPKEDSVIVDADTPGPSNAKSARSSYGDCPVCARRMKMTELLEHATACQGFELNGGNGLHVNPGESQTSCVYCNQLIPEIVIDEHVEECPARGSRTRVVPNIQKKRSSFIFR